MSKTEWFIKFGIGLAIMGLLMYWFWPSECPSINYNPACEVSSTEENLYSFLAKPVLFLLLLAALFIPLGRQRAAQGTHRWVWLLVIIISAVVLSVAGLFSFVMLAWSGGPSLEYGFYGLLPFIGLVLGLAGFIAGLVHLNKGGPKGVLHA